MTQKQTTKAAERFGKFLARNACYDGRKWAEGKTLADAWRECNNVGFMSWYLYQVEPRRWAHPARRRILEALYSVRDLALSLTDNNGDQLAMRDKLNARACNMLRAIVPVPPEFRLPTGRNRG